MIIMTLHKTIALLVGTITISHFQVAEYINPILGIYTLTSIVSIAYYKLKTTIDIANSPWNMRQPFTKVS